MEKLINSLLSDVSRLYNSFNVIPPPQNILSLETCRSRVGNGIVCTSKVVFLELIFVNFWLPRLFSELFFLPRNGSERHSKSLLHFFFPRNGIRKCFLISARFKDQLIRLLLFLKGVLRLARIFFCFLSYFDFIVE